MSSNPKSDPRPSQTRVKFTTPEVLPQDASEGMHAAWWRERIMKMSRPTLAELIGYHPDSIRRFEESEEVPLHYRLICAGLALGGQEWAWQPVGDRRAIAYHLRKAQQALGQPEPD